MKSDFKRGYNPMHTILGVSSIESSVTYFWVDVHRVLLLNSWQPDPVLPYCQCRDLGRETLQSRGRAERKREGGREGGTDRPRKGQKQLRLLPIPIPPPSQGSLTWGLSSLHLLNSRHTLEKPHWAGRAFTWGKRTNIPFPQGDHQPACTQATLVGI